MFIRSLKEKYRSWLLRNTIKKYCEGIHPTYHSDVTTLLQYIDDHNCDLKIKHLRFKFNSKFGTISLLKDRLRLLRINRYIISNVTYGEVYAFEYLELKVNYKYSFTELILPIINDILDIAPDVHNAISDDRLIETFGTILSETATLIRLVQKD